MVKSLDTKKYSVIYSNLYEWLAVVSPDPEFSRAGFKSMSELQPSFSKALSQLEEVLAVPERSFDKTDFINELTKFREVLLKQKRHKAQGLPLNINP